VARLPSTGHRGGPFLGILLQAGATMNRWHIVNILMIAAGILILYLLTNLGSW